VANIECSCILPDRRSTPTLNAGYYDGTRVSFFSHQFEREPTEDAIMRAVFGHAIKRSRKTATEPIGVGFKVPNELTLPISSKLDPRFVALVRILARQAARDFIQAAWDGLPPLFDAKDDRIARQRSVRPSISRNTPP
jgi:hypothetical protein